MGGRADSPVAASVPARPGGHTVLRLACPRVPRALARKAIRCSVSHVPELRAPEAARQRQGLGRARRTRAGGLGLLPAPPHISSGTLATLASLLTRSSVSRDGQESHPLISGLRSKQVRTGRHMGLRHHRASAFLSALGSGRGGAGQGQGGSTGCSPTLQGPPSGPSMPATSSPPRLIRKPLPCHGWGN